MSTAGRYAIISNQNEVTAAFAAFDNDKEAPMTWKEKRLITVLSIVLAVLFAAVLIVLSIRYRQARAETDGQTAMAETAQLAESDYVNLAYDNGSAYLAFALDTEGAWYWENEPDFPLDDTQLRVILTLLRTLRPQQTLDRPEDLSECGLDAPAASLTATAPDGGVPTIAMGNATTDGTSRYADINSDSEHIYIISGDLYTAMQTPVYEMCRLPELPTLAEAQMLSITLQGPKTEQADTETDGRRTTVLTAVHAEDDAASVSWRAGGANITDDASLRALLEDLAALRVTKCVDWHPSDEAAVFCGFDDPVTLTVSYQTDSGAETSFEMKVGTQNMDGTGRYVRFGEEEAIYLMELELLDPLMRLAYQGMDEPA